MPEINLDIQYVAHLARLELTPEEQQEYGAQLANVLHYFQKLERLDVGQVEPTAHVVPIHNVTRPDLIQPVLAHDEAMRNAPAQNNGLFLVPKIVE
jgi:aspartyl-tRNA(Asn)/glutamyl-tRNA(Gln) amidotransferase subunit C